VEMEFDVKKSPLGKLSKKQIKEGYEVLKLIEDELKSNNASNNRLAELSSRFYTLIPHALGRNALPIIKSSETVKKKMEMLNALADIEIATKILKETGSSDSTENHLDLHYKKLKCDIEPLEKNSDEFQLIQTYVKNTHQGQVPVVDEVYKLVREGEDDRYKTKKSLGNEMMLWHGSRLTNYVGIISQGLRIAPPEAPKSGYRFGKGIYFADMMSLSSKYCRSGNDDFAMLLGHVALGVTADLTKDQYMEKPLPNTHSTKALGSIEPNPKENVKLGNIVVPCGKIVNSGHTNVSCIEHQYIVYDVSQVALKYLLLLKWV